MYIVYMYDGSYIVDHANILLLLFSNIQRNGERVGEEAGDKEGTNRNESWRVGDASYYHIVSDSQHNVRLRFQDTSRATLNIPGPPCHCQRAGGGVR